MKITNVDYDSKRISLSIRALLEDGAAVETAAEEAVSEERPLRPRRKNPLNKSWRKSYNKEETGRPFPLYYGRCGRKRV